MIAMLAACLVAQLCLTLCDPMNGSPPSSSVYGILQARILEWVAFPSPGNLPNPEIQPNSPAFQADSLLSKPPGKPGHMTMLKMASNNLQSPLQSTFYQ